MDKITPQEPAKKIESFRDLIVWQKAADLAVYIYTATDAFPKSEIYGLVNQMRRAVVSVSSNIAEGFRRGHVGEKNQFYHVALGSLAELESQCEIARRLAFISPEAYERILEDAEEISRMMRKMIRSLHTSSSILHSSPGFSLAELIVAIGLFSIVTSIAVGGLTNLLRAQRQVGSLLSANANISTVVEQMAREIRTGYAYRVAPPGLQCVNAAGNPAEPVLFEFTDAFGQSIRYCLRVQNAGAPFTNLTINAIQREEWLGVVNIDRNIMTADNVSIARLNFVSTPIAGYPSRVTISMRVVPVDPAISSISTDIQTTVSSRAE